MSGLDESARVLVSAGQASESLGHHHGWFR
jgi:hypothetical protein